MPITYDRPFKTYREQLDRLEKQYALGINRNKFELEILGSISYYDLINGYKDCFMINDKYIPGITKEYLFQFLLFDKNVQNLLFKYSVYAENTFKTKLAYIISKNIGVDENIYLDKTNYAKNSMNKKKRVQLLKLISDIKDVLLKTKDNPTYHYRSNHNHVPPWILFKNITFNNSIDLYSFLQTSSKTEFILEYFKETNISYEDKTKMLKNMITIIRKFRNKIAHNSKVVNYHIEAKYELNRQNLLKILPKEIYNSKDVKDKRGSRDLFSMVLSLIKLLGNKYLILSFIQELYFLFSSNSAIANEYIKLTNLPTDLLEKLENLKSIYEVELVREIAEKI